jgi:hypothetical protein
MAAKYAFTYNWSSVQNLSLVQLVFEAAICIYIRRYEAVPPQDDPSQPLEPEKQAGSMQLFAQSILRITPYIRTRREVKPGYVYVICGNTMRLGRSRESTYSHLIRSLYVLVQTSYDLTSPDFIQWLFPTCSKNCTRRWATWCDYCGLDGCAAICLLPALSKAGHHGTVGKAVFSVQTSVALS